MPAWSLKPLKTLTLELSYGHGIPGVDDSLPESEDTYSFWLSPTTTADILIEGQVREFDSVEAHRSALLTVRVDVATLNDGATLDIAITVNGVESAIAVTIPTGATADTTFQSTGAITVAAGDTVGVSVATSQAMDDASVLRCEVLARLI